jgi:hypoxanthine phosphoribosyltransferase
MSAPESIPAIDQAERLHTPQEVEAAADRLAEAIDAWLDGRDCVALCLLQGAIVTTGMLLPRLRAPLHLDSIHVTRYRNTTRGHDLEWFAQPRTPLAGRRVLIIDDILDEGHSLAAVERWCTEQGATEVRAAVLVDKKHDRRTPEAHADFVGLEIPDRYVFGYGMDYHGWHRNAPGIYALPE